MIYYVIPHRRLMRAHTDTFALFVQLVEGIKLFKCAALMTSLSTTKQQAWCQGQAPSTHGEGVAGGGVLLMPKGKEAYRNLLISVIYLVTLCF